MKRAKLLFTLTALVATGVFVATSITNMETFNFFQIKATDEQISLQHGDIANLNNVYKNGVFSCKTPLNNNVDWEYKYGKLSTGLIDLGKNKIGNPGLDDFYIGNTSPITSISSLTVNFTNANYLYLYGSSNQTDYYLVDTYTSTHLTSTRIAKYLYFRIVNGNQEDNAVTLNSITVNYSCLASDYSDEGIDITSKSVLSDSNNVLSLDTDHKYGGFNSEKSLKVVAPASGSSSDWVLSLDHEYTGAEIKKATLSFYVNTLDNTKYDDSHNYIRFLIYPGTNSSRNKNKLNVQTGNIANGTDWNQQIYSFSGLSGLGDTEIINSLYIRSVYVNGETYLDQMHLSLGMQDLDQSIINAYEINDMISEDIHYGYGTVTANYDYAYTCGSSVRSSKIHIDSDWRMWYYNNIGMGENLKGKIISYDVLYTDFSGGKTSASTAFKFNYDGERYSITINNSSEGVAITSLENGWSHVVLDIDTIHEVISSDGSGDLNNLGWNVGFARTIYIDNLRVEENDAPDYPVVTIDSPANNEVVEIAPEEAVSYSNALHSSRSEVVNDYVIDPTEVINSDSHPRIEDYYDKTKHHDYSVSVVLRYHVYNHSTDGVKVHLSTDSGFTNEKIYQSNSLIRYELTNLLRNTKYYWKIITNDSALTSETYSFVTSDTARFISAGKVYNVRDFGGYMTRSGKRIKQGLVFRGQEIVINDYYVNSDHHIANLTEEVSNIFLNDLGIKKDVDLRNPEEREAIKGSPLGNTVEYCPVPEYCPAYEHAPKHPDKLETVFKAFLEVDTKPVYFHCRGGADRTGTIGFILGGLLGMSYTDLLLEYEFTSFSKNYRPRDDNPYSYTTFPEFINTLYDDTYGFDQSGNHDIQEICTNIMLAAGLTQSELNTIKTKLLEE